MIRTILTYYKVTKNELEWWGWCATMALTILLGGWMITGMAKAVESKPKWEVADEAKVAAVQAERMYERRKEMYGD